ncbi:MAG: hypothetical protein ACOYOA_14495 [Saprospiraceae bacterium]
MKLPLLTFILFLGLIPVLAAQTPVGKGAKKKASPVNLEPAAKMYSDFKKEGILLVKLPTGSKKFTAIRQQLQKSPSRRLEKYLEKEQNKVTKIQLSLMDGFKKFYTFSPVVAIYDSSYQQALANPKGNYTIYDCDLAPVSVNPIAGKKILTFRLDRYNYDEFKSAQAYVLTDEKGIILPFPFPNGIPVKFRRCPLIEDSRGDLFGAGNAIRRKSAARFYKRYTWKKLDKDPYKAIVKMLQLKLDIFEPFIEYYSTKS